jgi:hypothetical protein
MSFEENGGDMTESMFFVGAGASMGIGSRT